MYSPSPSPDTGDASTHLDTLLAADIPVPRFQSDIRRLHDRFERYAAVCPSPFIAPGVVVSPELRIQSERYLPITEISAAFRRLYGAALSYSPILSSTPFYQPLSWVDTLNELPPFMQFSVNPACLLEKLLASRTLLIAFICASFLPRRFYGGCWRYPEQQIFIRKWLASRKRGVLRCLDVACGTGEGTYGMTRLLAEHGLSPEEVHVEGWTLEPLEVWAATHCSFPHDRHHESRVRETTASLFRQGYGRCIRFDCRDVLKQGASGESEFDLILCNGLLGGPIMSEKSDVNRVVAHLSRLLTPGGILLAADSFHGGWKQKCPQSLLRASCESYGLQCFGAGEGVGALKPDKQSTPG